MVSLIKLYNQFIKRLTIIDERSDIIQKQITKIEDWKLRFLTETLISDLWQLWSNFCRNIVIISCSGTINRSGNFISPRKSDNSWQRIGYEAGCATKGAKIQAGKRLLFKRHEPTWGDQIKLIDIIMKIHPSNLNELITAFGLPVYGPRHLQIVRNACAHKNDETLNDVKRLLIYYGSSKITSPCDVAWQVDIKKNCFGIYSWCDDLNTIADQATIVP